MTNRNNLKVLFVGGGRRIILANYFIKAGFEVFAYETEKNAPISSVATILSGKKWNDPDILKHLDHLDMIYYFDLIIPLMDPAAVVLTQLLTDKPYFEAKIPTSPIPTTNKTALDKKAFAAMFEMEDFYPSIDDLTEKVIIKPIQGANSKGIQIISRETYAQDGSGLFKQNHIVQSYIEGGEEYSVDAYFNRHGKMIDAVPRKRLEVQGGEVSRSITMPPNYLGMSDLTKHIGEKIGLMGPACCQFVVDQSGKVWVMEINARLGGGATLSLAAGFDMVDLMKQEYVEGKIADPKDYQEQKWKQNFGMVRYFQEQYYEST